jgi:hypothetical protein
MTAAHPAELTLSTLCGYSGIQIEVRKAGIERRHW